MNSNSNVYICTYCDEGFDSGLCDSGYSDSGCSDSGYSDCRESVYSTAEGCLPCDMCSLGGGSSCEAPGLEGGG